MKSQLNKKPPEEAFHPRFGHPEDDHLKNDNGLPTA
jgi:hypothetical protein